MARTMFASRGKQILTRDVRVIFIAATGFCNRMANAPSGQFEKIDFGSSKAICSRSSQSAPGSGRTTFSCVANEKLKGRFPMR